MRRYSAAAASGLAASLPLVATTMEPGVVRSVLFAVVGLLATIFTWLTLQSTETSESPARRRRAGPRSVDAVVVYGWADLLWAEWIAWCLAAEGYVIDKREVDLVGVTPAAEGRAGLVVVAGRGLDADAASSLSLDQGRARRRDRDHVLVVRVDGASVPAPLTAAVDITDETDHRARQVVVAAGASRRWPCSGEPPSGAESAAPPRFPPAYPTNNLREAPTQFVDRRDSLDRLANELLVPPAGSAPRVGMLCGESGIGKTGLALRYAHHYRSAYELIWFVDGETPDELQHSLTRLADELRLPAGDLADRLEWLWKELARYRRWLLIFDDVDDETGLHGYWPGKAGPGTVLVTSHREGWHRELDLMEPVVDLAEPDRVELLCRWAGSADRDGARALATAVGGSPLLLEQLGELAAADFLPWRRCLEVYETNWPEVISRGVPADHASLAATFEVGLDRVRAVAPTAVQLLELFAFLGGNDIPVDLLPSHADRLRNPLAATVRQPLVYGEALRTLSRYYGLRITGTVIQLHDARQRYVREILKPQQRRRRVATLLEVLTAGFAASDQGGGGAGGGGDAADPDELVLHAMAALEHADQLGLPPAARSTLLQRVGDHHRGRRQLTQARDVLNQALALRESGDAEADTEAVAETLTSLADVRLRLRPAQDALQLAERAHELRTSAGAASPGLVRSVELLAEILAEVSRTGEALPLLDQAVLLSNEVHGPRHARTAELLALTAYVSRRVGDPRRARDLFERANAIWRDAGNPVSQSRIRARFRLGLVLLDLQEPAAAGGHIAESWRLAVEAFGEDDYESVRIENELAKTLALAGDTDAAERHNRHAMAFMERYFPEHAAYAQALLAFTLVCAGRPPEAVEIAARAVAAEEAERGSTHPYVAEMLIVLGLGQDSTGDLDAARHSYERAVAIYEESNPGHYVIASILDLLGGIAEKQGAHDESEAFADRARLIRADAGL